MVELLLIVRVAGRRIALPAGEVEGVVELDELTPVPGAASHLAGLSALRSRVLTVIDSRASLGFPQKAPAQFAEAVLIPSGGHAYALLVEQVEDVVEAASALMPVRAPPGRGWDRVVTGMVEAAGNLLLMVDPHALVSGPPVHEAG